MTINKTKDQRNTGVHEKEQFHFNNLSGQTDGKIKSMKISKHLFRNQLHGLPACRERLDWCRIPMHVTCYGLSNGCDLRLDMPYN